MIEKREVLVIEKGHAGKNVSLWFEGFEGESRDLVGTEYPAQVTLALVIDEFGPNDVNCIRVDLDELLELEALVKTAVKHLKRLEAETKLESE